MSPLGWWIVGVVGLGVLVSVLVTVILSGWLASHILKLEKRVDELEKTQK